MKEFFILEVNYLLVKKYIFMYLFMIKRSKDFKEEELKKNGKRKKNICSKERNL